MGEVIGRDFTLNPKGPDDHHHHQLNDHRPGHAFSGRRLPSWCANDHEDIDTHRSESVAVFRVPSASGKIVTHVHLAQCSRDSRPRIYINGQPHTPDAADLVARAIIRLETHLHSMAVGAALDAGDVQAAAGAFLTQLEAGRLDA